MSRIKYVYERPSLAMQMQDPCVYCNGTANTWDHIDAVSRGGKHATDNLARSCRKCNGEKASMTVLEFLCRRAESRLLGISVKAIRTRDFVEQHREDKATDIRAMRLMRRWKRKAAREAQILKERSGTKDSYQQVLSAMLNDVDYAKAQGWITETTT